MMDGRPYFVAGYTPGEAPYGIYLDELDDHYLTEMITPGRPDLPGGRGEPLLDAAHIGRD
jgi:hypothetical protein